MEGKAADVPAAAPVTLWASGFAGVVSPRHYAAFAATINQVPFRGLDPD